MTKQTPHHAPLEPAGEMRAGTAATRYAD